MGIKYGVNEEFFKSWSSQSAYILGYFYADGSLEDASYLRGKYIRISSIDKSLIFYVKHALNSKHSIVVVKPHWPNGKLQYLLRIGSHKLYESLLHKGLYPNKSLSIKFPKIPAKYLRDFIRGYFDGDGCIYLQMSKGKIQKLIIKKLTTIFTSGSKVFLQQLAGILHAVIGTKQTKIYNSHRSFQLRCTTTDSIKLFKFLYRYAPFNFCLKRKLKVFIKYFILRPTKRDREVDKILKQINYGHVVKRQTRRSAKPLYAGSNPAMASRIRLSDF